MAHVNFIDFVMFKLCSLFSDSVLLAGSKLLLYIYMKIENELCQFRVSYYYKQMKNENGLCQFQGSPAMLIQISI